MSMSYCISTSNRNITYSYPCGKKVTALKDLRQFNLVKKLHFKKCDLCSNLPETELNDWQHRPFTISQVFIRT
jgi:hypothetical protein